jgi:radical SAM superfamily enzyme
MKCAGFTRLNLALVSSDTTVLETTKRPHTVAKYLEVVEAAHRLGFAITSYQILGLPFESLASMVQTLKQREAEIWRDVARLLSPGDGDDPDRGDGGTRAP